MLMVYSAVAEPAAKVTAGRSTETSSDTSTTAIQAVSSSVVDPVRAIVTVMSSPSVTAVGAACTLTAGSSSRMIPWPESEVCPNSKRAFTGFVTMTLKDPPSP